jgi:hypothetical protein
MQDSKWSLGTTSNDDDEYDIARPKSPEELVDQVGFRTALLVLSISFLIAALWIVNRPSFEKCSGIENSLDRYACYDQLRNELFKPPSKGGNIRY